MAESSIKEKRARRRKRRREALNEPAEATAEAAEKGITEKKGYATPSRRKGESTQERPNPVVRFFGGIVEYFEGVRSELEKVTWPTREETIRLSNIVGIVTLISALVLGGLSIIFTELFNIGVDQPLVFVGVFVAFIALLYAYSRYMSQNSGEY